MRPHPTIASTWPELETGWTQALATAIARQLARRFFALEVRGVENLPGTEPVILCANHTSHVDTFALACATGAASRRLVFLAARDYFSRFRLRGLLLRRVICIAGFDRGAGIGAAKHNLQLLAACRDAGRIIVLFPEGTRAPDGRMRAFKPGVGMFADKLQLRVVPCRIEGAHAALPKGKRWPRSGRLRVSFGAPIAIDEGGPDERGAERAARYEAFAARLAEAVSALGPTSERREETVFSA